MQGSFAIEKSDLEVVQLVLAKALTSLIHLQYLQERETLNRLKMKNIQDQSILIKTLLLTISQVCENKNSGSEQRIEI